MKRYWFYGNMPAQTISENELSDEQKKIVSTEKNVIDDENFIHGWVGFRNGDGWDFMRHGLEVIHIDDKRGNIARKKLKEIIENKYCK